MFFHASLENSKLAMNAAAAKALDCFAYRECHGKNEVPILRCCDEPYFRGNAPPLPEPPKGVTLINSRLHIEKNHPTQGNDQSISTSGPSKSTPVKNTTDSPKAILHQWYTDYWRRISKSFFMASHCSVKQRLPEKDSFTTWSNRKFNSAERRFTSVFICPWTGERFLSGKLIGENNSYSEEEFLFVNAHQTISKKLVWYREWLIEYGKLFLHLCPLYCLSYFYNNFEFTPLLSFHTSKDRKKKQKMPLLEGA